MPQTTANGIRLTYETYGPETGAPLLLICGLGMQMIRWPQGFLDALTDRGFRVIAMDNRDVGLSQWFDEADLQAIVAERQAGRWPEAPYYLSDMAADCAGLLDALAIPQAHIAGMSMGGMIAQLVACDHRAKALSLTSIMSTTSEPGLPPGTPEALEALSKPRPHPDDDLETFLELSVATSRAIGSPAYPAPEAEIHARALADARRAWRPQGFARQYAAIMASPGRAAKLAALDLPRRRLTPHPGEAPRAGGASPPPERRALGLARAARPMGAPGLTRGLSPAGDGRSAQSSGKWQATPCPGARAATGGTSAAHSGCARGQRVRNRQPEGGSTG